MRTADRPRSPVPARPPVALLGAVVLLAAAWPSACGGTPAAPAPLPPPPATTPGWTETFLREGVLLAEDVAIEGPEELVAHVAVRQDPENASYTTETTAAGLVQQLVARSGRGLVELRAQLDGLEIVATRRLRVVVRPGDVPVVVRAQGDVFLRWEDEAEQRAPSMNLVGERPIGGAP